MSSTRSVRHPSTLLLPSALLLLAAFAAERLAFEALFPRATWLGERYVAVGLSMLAATLLLRAAWRWLNTTSNGAALLTLAPLLLNALWLFDATVDLVASRLLFGLSVWLVGVVWLLQTRRSADWRLLAVCILFALLPIYWATLGRDVGSADTFEFQVTAPQLGIAHPTGYPLYLLLGKLWTLLLPVANVAMRLNIGTMVYALVAMVLLGRIVTDLTDSTLMGVVAALVVGLRPTFWSQAVAAEVYTLHSVFVMFLIWRLGRHVRLQNANASAEQLARSYLLMAVALGLGLTNHLTTILLVPAILVILFVDWRAGRLAAVFLSAGAWTAHTVLRQTPPTLPKKVTGRSTPDRTQADITSRVQRPRPPLRQQLLGFLTLGLACLLPLSLYAYLPLRWRAVNGESMGFGRLIEWVTGDRFADALQWGAWLADTTRYGIVGRLFLSEWGWIGLAVALVGFVWLIASHRQYALMLFVTWFAFSFYCLNYYVPDLNVFLIPAHLMLGVCWGAAFALPQRLLPEPVATLLLLVLSAPAIVAASADWQRVDASQPNELTTWGRAVLAQELAADAAILADSEKHPPLYYLQQAEGVRSDLDISVLPDEAAYRADLGRRLDAGQTVYLARFLPRLPWPMRAVGPLTEVLPERLLDAANRPIVIPASDGIGVVEATLTPVSDYDPLRAELNVVWKTTEPQTAQRRVYLRWQLADDSQIDLGSHQPVNGFYPTIAWQPNELVADFYLLERPFVVAPTQATLEFALAPPFSSAEQLVWTALETVELRPIATQIIDRPVRLWNAAHAISSVTFSDNIRLAQPIEMQIAALTACADQLDMSASADGGFMLAYSEQPCDTLTPQTWQLSTSGLNAAATWAVSIAEHDRDLHCGWMQRAQRMCQLGQTVVSGVPLPTGATNYGDMIALLDIDVPDPQLVPGGILSLDLNWQALGPITDDYTVFVQVLDQNDTIVGQVDTWPVQGTRPTSQWEPGVDIRDPYQVQLSAELAPGDYKLFVGLYLLRDMSRLPVLDNSGTPIGDKTTIPNLYVP